MSNFQLRKKPKEEEPSIAIPEEMLAKSPETEVSEKAEPEEQAPEKKPDQEKKELTR